jgi:hypothetical protein
MLLPYRSLFMRRTHKAADTALALVCLLPYVGRALQSAATGLRD